MITTTGLVRNMNHIVIGIIPLAIQAFILD
jgi:hypothetical protein